MSRRTSSRNSGEDGDTSSTWHVSLSLWNQTSSTPDRLIRTCLMSLRCKELSTMCSAMSGRRCRSSTINRQFGGKTLISVRICSRDSTSTALTYQASFRGCSCRIRNAAYIAAVLFPHSGDPINSSRPPALREVCSFLTIDVSMIHVPKCSLRGTESKGWCSIDATDASRRSSTLAITPVVGPNLRKRTHTFSQCKAIAESLCPFPVYVTLISVFGNRVRKPTVPAVP